MKARALRVNIFENKNIGNCSNHGISEKFSQILLLCDDGPYEVDLENPPENLCVFIKRKLFGREADYIRPYADPEGVGWMNGGSIAYTSDSRFPCNHPVCLHDRQETQDMYDMLSR